MTEEFGNNRNKPRADGAVLVGTEMACHRIQTEMSEAADGSFA